MDWNESSVVWAGPGYLLTWRRPSQISSYGGILRYTVSHEAQPGGELTSETDVQLKVWSPFVSYSRSSCRCSVMLPWNPMESPPRRLSIVKGFSGGVIHVWGGEWGGEGCVEGGGLYNMVENIDIRSCCKSRIVPENFYYISITKKSITITEQWNNF